MVTAIRIPQGRAARALHDGGNFARSLGLPRDDEEVNYLLSLYERGVRIEMAREIGAQRVFPPTPEGFT